MYQYDRLSPQDAAFLYMESADTPMHVGSLGVFESSDVDFDTMCEHIDRRLDLVPKYRRKLMWVPYRQGRPVWVDDEDFDIRFHVRHAGLPRPGDRRQLLNTFSRIASLPLDRRRPLWEVWLLDLPDGRLGMIQKTHHSLVDGISGVDVATILLDVTPDTPQIDAPRWEPQPAPTKNQLLLSSLRQRVVEPAEALRSARSAVRTPLRALRETAESVMDAVDFGFRGLKAGPRTSINTGGVGPQRRFEYVSLGLDDVKSAKNRHGTTVNDVVLAMVTGGLRRLFEERGTVPAEGLRALVPVSVRSDDQRGTLGNRVAGLMPYLPVFLDDPIAMLRTVHEEMKALKGTHDVLSAEMIMRLADFAPPTLLSLAGRALVNSRAVNLTVTNVPGPQVPLYFMGGRLLEAYPYIPLTHTMEVGVAVLSISGQLNFGLVGDYDTVPDLQVLAEGIEKTLRDLL